jgi:hypothetical protein
MFTPEATELEALIQNQAPELVPTFRELFLPKGNSRITTSPHFANFIVLALRGTPPRLIRRIFDEEYHEQYTLVELRDYIYTYIPPRLMKAALLFRAVENTTEELSSDQMLENVLRTQYIRVQSLIEGESVRSEELRRELDLFTKMVHTNVTVKALLKRPGMTAEVKEPLPVGGTVTPPLVNLEANPRISNRDAARVMQVIEAIAKIATTKEEEPPATPTPSSYNS